MPPTSSPPFPPSALRRTGAWALALVLAAAALPAQQVDRIDADRLLRDISILAHDSMEGRESGTEGIERVRSFLIPAFDKRGLEPVEGARTQDFLFLPGGARDTVAGVNVMGLVRGTEHPDRYLVLTAHYDHLGIRDGKIYNGADDNASGTAALLALGEYLSRNPLRHSLLVVAFDAEEKGLQGARAWVAAPPVPLDSVVLNVNLDMISRSEAGELYAVGTHHYPFLRDLVEEVARTDRLTLLMGHDRPDLPPGDDWTGASDHAAFHQLGIPFIYFGVEDHPGYHQPTDVVEEITPDFYVAAVETALDFLLVADREGEAILKLGRNLRP